MQIASILNKKNMIWVVCVFACCVLTHRTVLVAAQSMASSCEFSLSGYEESLQFNLDEHDQRLETMNQSMNSAFEKLEAAVSRTNIRGQEEICQDLKTLYYNMSVNLDSLSEKIPERLECRTTQEQEEYLRVLNLSLTSMVVRTEERIQAVNESLSSTLQTVNRSLDEKFQVMQVQLQDQSSTLQTVSRNLDYKLQAMNGSVVDALREHDQKLQTMNETLSSSVDTINEKLNAILNQVNETLQYIRDQDHCRRTSDVYDCSDIKANGHTTSGVYRICVVYEGQRYYANASCDMTTTNDAWTVFQRRKDGSVDFYREWSDYEYGFGNPNGEFWLGNNFLHLLTSKRRYRLRIDLEDFEGGKRYAEYSTFNISSSADKYRLTIGTYSGTADDSLSYSNDYRFSTKDSDNDVDSSLNCAVNRHGAWWYRSCAWSNLNGLYLRGRYSTNGSFNGQEGIQWHYWRGEWYSLKTTEMKISSS